MLKLALLLAIIFGAIIAVVSVDEYVRRMRLSPAEREEEKNARKRAAWKDGWHERFWG